MRPAKTQISPGVRPVWSESSLSAWRKFGSLATHWAHSEDSDQTRRMPRLFWVFAGRTATLLVLSCRGSYGNTVSTLRSKRYGNLIFSYWSESLNQLSEPIWTASSEFGTYRLCEQRRFRRACASAQSRQNLRCSLIQAANQEEPSDRKLDP